MLVCIPTRGNAGLEDAVNDHFGSAAYFTIYDTDTHEVKNVENRDSHHSHGTCHPLKQLQRHALDCVVCRGMGRRAIDSLNHSGIKVLLTSAAKVSEVVAELEAGSLKEADPAQACRGHGHGSGSMHDHGRHQGEGHGCRQGGQGTRTVQLGEASTRPGKPGKPGNRDNRGDNGGAN